MRKQSRSRFRWYWCWNRCLEFLRLGDCGTSSHRRELQDGAILTRSFPESLNLYPVSVWGLSVPPPIIRTFQTVNRATIDLPFLKDAVLSSVMSTIWQPLVATVWQLLVHTLQRVTLASVTHFDHRWSSDITSLLLLDSCAVLPVLCHLAGSYSRSLVPTMVVAVESPGR